MVRTREKKAKGDSAFTKQKQKVGRKKLAPATATRAEVHARTLRLTTSTAMSAAMAAPHVADPARHPPSSATTTSGQKATEEKRKRPVIAVQNFAELLSGTHHYKSAQRASAFATLSRLLTAQKVKDDAAAAVAATRAPTTAFDEYMRYAASTAAAAGEGASATPSSSGLSGLTALEKLKSFAAALEAVTDTDDDVRRSALESLEVLVDYQWIAPDREGGTGGGGAAAAAAVRPPTTAAALPAAAAATRDAAELEQSDALLQEVQAGQVSEAERVLSAAGPALASATAALSLDRVQAILQAVHVALTHALKPVRLSGVELLALLLRVTPAALVRTAARAVCRHQTAYYHSAPTAAAGGLTMAGVKGSAARGGAEQAAAASAAAAGASSALAAAQSRAASLVEEEERWMLTLLRRVSTLVLRTKYVAVLPALLGVFLGHGGDAAPGGESVVVALLCSTMGERSGVSGGGGGAAAAADVDSSTGDGASPQWRHPELVNTFFDEVAPQWANHWKELMELRLELLRQDEKLFMASALARSFATVLVFLKRQQQQQQLQQQQASGGSGKVNFFSRNRMYYIKALFIEKMPVTMQELLVPSSGSSDAAASFSSPTAVSPRSMKARLELGLALVMVCVPLAGTEEGWYLMRDYFSIVFSVARPTPQSTRGDASGDATGKATPNPAAAAAAPSFRFPSVALMEMSVRLYEQVLRLYPCTAAHICLADTDASTSAAATTTATTEETAVWKGPAAASPTSAETHRRRPSKHAQAAAASSQQHSTVALRLISLFPALLNTVIKHLVPRGEGAAVACEEAALVRTLLCVAHVLDRVAAFPDDLLRGRRGNGVSTGDDGTAAAKKLEEGFGLVPRLLFALREQKVASRPAVAGNKRARAAAAAAEEEGAKAEEDNSSAGANAAPAPVETRVGVLLAYSGIADALVRRLLRVLWFLSSSGHPLVTNSGAGGGSSSTSTPLALLLKKSVAFLFGNPQAGLDGVLQRCAAPTVLLAHSILFYLGEAATEEHSISAVDDEGATTMMRRVATQWADVVDVLRAIPCQKVIA